MHISPIKNNGDYYEWTVAFLDTLGEKWELNCSTSRNGEGLWVGERQEVGTMQFDLNCSPATRRLRVVRLMRQRFWSIAAA